MSSFLFAVSCILPLFVMVLAGSILQRLGWLSREALPTLNKLCFNLLLPCMIVNSALNADLTALSSPRLYVYALSAYTLFVILLTFLSKKTISDRARAGAFVHASFRPNNVLIGIPVAISVMGADGALPAIILAVLMSPLDNIYGVLALQRFSATAGHGWKRELLAVIRNPMVIGGLLGVGVALLPFELPSFFTQAVASLGGAALPIAMLIIGARFELKRLRRDRTLILLSAGLKLLVMPITATLCGLALGLSAHELFPLWLMFAMPTAAVSSVITGEMGCDGLLGDEMTLVSTALSAVTLIAGVTLFAARGLI